jgi:hypothetical protein
MSPWRQRQLPRGISGENSQRGLSVLRQISAARKAMQPRPRDRNLPVAESRVIAVIALHQRE